MRPPPLRIEDPLKSPGNENGNEDVREGQAVTNEVRARQGIFESGEEAEGCSLPRVDGRFVVGCGVGDAGDEREKPGEWIPLSYKSGRNVGLEAHHRASVGRSSAFPQLIHESTCAACSFEPSPRSLALLETLARY